MLLATAAASIATSNNVFAYKTEIRQHHRPMLVEMVNSQLNVGCQNIDCQIQGDENSCAQAAQQTFPAAEVVPPTPPVPPAEACRECLELLSTEQLQGVGNSN